MPYISTNPANNQVISTIPTIDPIELQAKLSIAQTTQKSWSKTTLLERKTLTKVLAQLFRDKRQELASLITLEMGCPITQALAEIDKCASMTDSFADNFERWLAPEIVQTTPKLMAVHFDPVGTLFHIAPWNYPFYLALRPIVPAILAGNSVVLKPASNVGLIGQKIQELFQEAGFSAGVMQTIFVDTTMTDQVISHDAVQVISLIGSERAGSAVGAIAGKHIKKTVMELGGNDPMLVYADSDITKAIDGIMASRMRNCGQSCNAPKRIIVEDSIYENFVEALKIEVSQIIIGDPLLPETQMGPISSERARTEVLEMIDQSIELGAVLILGGKAINRTGNYMEPTILGDVTKSMSVFVEECFGPVISLIRAKRLDMVELANDSKYGLGASIWTADIEFAKTLIPQIESGNVYINSVVRGDPLLPFGGVKKTGFGREFSHYGIKEFVNIKSVVIS